MATGTGRPLVECLVPEDWNTPVANHHYSLGQIAGALSLMLDCRGSLRGTALATGLIGRLLGGKHEVPSPTSVRSWLLHVGLHQLQRPLEKADDWVWIVDHTVQIGELKCMLIVAFRLGVAACWPKMSRGGRGLVLNMARRWREAWWPDSGKLFRPALLLALAGIEPGLPAR